MGTIDKILLAAFQKVAVSQHTFQSRKSAKNDFLLPYVYHPIAVGQLVWEWGAGSFTNLAACACHDVLEDCDISLDDFMSMVWTEFKVEHDRLSKSGQIDSKPEEFGVFFHKAVSIINELTFIPSETNTKENYLANFATKSIDALIIKLADRYCNVQDFAKSGDHKYATKYLNKAQPLFDIFESKKYQIDSYYTYPVSNHIQKHYDALRFALKCE